MRALAGAGLVLALAVSGCSKSPPPVTEVSGVVLLDGQPLPKALVEFVPDLPNFGAEMNSTGITDDKGQFSLICTYQGERKSGAVVAKHFVLVRELPPDAASRRQDATAPKLANRPIPSELGSLGKNPYTVEVKQGQKEYKITLKRPAKPRGRD
jgi:hypothetical protein